jgi:hypothetical protein
MTTGGCAQHFISFRQNINKSKNMKIIIPVLALFLAGCGAHSNNDQTDSTNATAGGPPGGPGNVNTPVIEMTNAPMVTNSSDTNFPAGTNK